MGLVAFFALRDASIAAGLTIFVRLATHFSALRVAPIALLALVMFLAVAVHGTAGDEDTSSKKNFKIRFHNVIFLFTSNRSNVRLFFDKDFFWMMKVNPNFDIAII